MGLACERREDRLMADGGPPSHRRHERDVLVASMAQRGAAYYARISLSSLEVRLVSVPQSGSSTPHHAHGGVTRPGP
jgi:hypothetical protein